MAKTTHTVQPNEVRPGDVLLKIDHVELRPMKVDRLPVTKGTTTVIHLEAPAGSTTEWQRYLEPGQHATVEREKPKAKRKGPQTTTRKGVKLVRREDGNWSTPDGRFRFEYDDGFEAECGEPHPMRIRDADYSASEFERGRWCFEKSQAVNYGKRGYLCPGIEFHTYALWSLYDYQAANGHGDVVDRAETIGALLPSLPAEYRTADPRA